jgi:amino acid permease
MESSSSTTADKEPLLQRSRSPSVSIASYSSISQSSDDDEEARLRNGNHLDRSLENDVLPETAVLGRNLGWSSAYILIMSRVIGSGIFATPGAIVQSVGSVGITLLLWVAGALISWLGLAISLEYGCMLPRSGGEHFCMMCTLR